MPCSSSTALRPSHSRPIGRVSATTERDIPECLRQVQAPRQACGCIRRLPEQATGISSGDGTVKQRTKSHVSPIFSLLLGTDQKRIRSGLEANLSLNEKMKSEKWKIQITISVYGPLIGKRDLYFIIFHCSFFIYFSFVAFDWKAWPPSPNTRHLISECKVTQIITHTEKIWFCINLGGVNLLCYCD